MSTAGRIKKSGPKFAPRRPNLASSSAASRSKREQSSTSNASVTPRQATAALPTLDVDEVVASKEAQISSTTSHSSPPRQAPKPLNGSPASSFGPSDPSIRFSQQPSPTQSSSPNRSQPPSSFAFTPRDPSATQATSIAPSSQVPEATQQSPPASPVRGTPFQTGGPPSSSSAAPKSSNRSQPTDPTRDDSTTVDPSVPKKKASLAGKASKDKGKGRTVEPIEEAEEGSETGQAGQGGAAGDEDGAGAGETVAAKTIKKRPAPKTSACGARGGKRAAPSSRKGKEKEKEVEGSNDEAEGEEQEEEEGTTRAARKNARPARGKASRAAGAYKEKLPEGGEGDEEESVDEYDNIKQRKRKPRAPKKRSKVDKLLFDDDEEEEGEGDELDGEPEDDGEGEGEDGQPSKRRKMGIIRRKKKSAAQDDEPLPAVDPSQTTMSQLAELNPKFDFGRPSERTLHYEQQKLNKKEVLKEKRRKMKARQQRKKDGLPTDSEDEDGDQDSVSAKKVKEPTPAKGAAGARETSPQALDAAEAMAMIGSMQQGGEDGDEDEDGNPVGTAGAHGGDEEEEEEEEEEGYGDLAETTFAPQMRIVDGQLVLDEESLQIDRSKPTNDITREVVEESAQDRFVNSRSFSKKPGKAKKWTVDDTERFYDALSQFGTDFELIAALFPGRTRREIKLKWTKEDKINPRKITTALMQRKKIDLDSYAKYSGQDLSGPMPADPMEEINERRNKLESEGHSGASFGNRRGGGGGASSTAVDLGKKGKGKKKKGAIDEAGAALFDEERIRAEEEEADRRRMEAEMEEEQRQAAIDAMDASDQD